MCLYLSHFPKWIIAFVCYLVSKSLCCLPFSSGCVLRFDFGCFGSNKHYSKFYCFQIMTNCFSSGLSKYNCFQSLEICLVMAVLICFGFEILQCFAQCFSSVSVQSPDSASPLSLCLYSAQYWATECFSSEPVEFCHWWRHYCYTKSVSLLVHSLDPHFLASKVYLSLLSICKTTIGSSVLQLPRSNSPAVVVYLCIPKLNLALSQV
jgi:hypothetical protein